MKNTYIAFGIMFSLCLGVYIGYVIHTPTIQLAGSSNTAAGTTFSTAKLAQVNFTIATGSATSTSLYNSDSYDRYIVTSFIGCNTVGTSKTAYTGTALAGLTFRMATTATAITTALGDSNINYASVLPFSTTTTVNFVSSSTPGILQGFSSVWDAGTYLTIQPNATNTAVCTGGVYYVGS